LRVHRAGAVAAPGVAGGVRGRTHRSFPGHRGVRREIQEQLERGWSDEELAQVRAQLQDRKPWTAELDRTLVQLWIDNEGIKNYADVFDNRDPLQVRARLERLGCDPDRPGHLRPGVKIDDYGLLPTTVLLDDDPVPVQFQHAFDDGWPVDKTPWANSPSRSAAPTPTAAPPG
jgi:hypothetical protein